MAEPAAAAAVSTRKLYGYALSSNSVRIAALLNEKGLDYELVVVDDTKAPDFLAINPLGQVPAFQDGDDILFESRAISRYIAAKYRSSGTDLLPATPSAKLEVWLEVESHHFYPAVADLVYELRVRPRLPGGAPPDPAVVDGLARKVADVLDVYDAHLAAGNRYLAGDAFTLADVNHMAQLFVMSRTPRAAELVAARPHVQAWWDDISARPAWKKTVAALPLPPA
ncbi:hypothetical protein CFC21_043827 [Triticum aestivum]|uniref:glutathione transferase n=2 Tax=Triticum aestivum TaxID=4565 RepID=A0A9R1FPJ6_WHEAT|nr:glutathione S-transferase 3-like [Triticum aestivum]KAF7032676.1 hypothetical protein CFC21_043827 [Triticum aestivum]CDM86047.1 unnamed protein product [Triticum aestivum]